MRLPAVRIAIPLVIAVLLFGGCTGGPPPQLDPAGSPGPTQPADAWSQLAALVATALDHRYVATYTLRAPDQAARTVTVTVATDGSWLVNDPAGALGGSADIAVADTAAGLYQCALGTTSPGCVRMAAPNGNLPTRDDPRVQYLFTRWLLVLTDRQQALSVDAATRLPGATGQCFSIEPNSAALAAPVDPGIYCYDNAGTLTAAKLAMGTFMLATGPAPAPPTITLPAPLTTGPALTIAAPPAPPPTSSPPAG